MIARWRRNRRSSPTTATGRIYLARTRELPAPWPRRANPTRVLTIAGPDSGAAPDPGRHATFADARGRMGCVPTAVTVQNSVGVKGFHELPLDVIARGRSVPSPTTSVQAAKTGMLASAEIIGAPPRLARSGAGLTVPLVVRPGARPCTATRCCTRRRWIRFAPNCFRWPLVTPKPRRGPAAGGRRASTTRTQREAIARLHALGPRWALVKGGHLRGAELIPTCCTTAPNSTVRRAAYGHCARPRRWRHPGRGDARSGKLFGSRRGGVRQDLVTRGILKQRIHKLGHGHGPALWRLQARRWRIETLAGIAHRPAGTRPGTWC